MSEPRLGASKAAILIGVSRQTIGNWRSNGWLPEGSEWTETELRAAESSSKKRLEELRLKKKERRGPLASTAPAAAHRKSPPTLTDTAKSATSEGSSVASGSPPAKGAGEDGAPPASTNTPGSGTPSSGQDPAGSKSHAEGSTKKPAEDPMRLNLPKDRPKATQAKPGSTPPEARKGKGGWFARFLDSWGVL